MIFDLRFWQNFWPQFSPQLFQVIAAEGEKKASRSLKEAADVINQSPFALQLRYLQTLSTISAEKNSTIIFPLPIDMLSQFLDRTIAWSQWRPKKMRFYSISIEILQHNHWRHVFRMTEPFLTFFVLRTTRGPTGKAHRYWTNCVV